MSIQIRYRTERDEIVSGTRHIAEARTAEDGLLSYTRLVTDLEFARYGEIIAAHAKRDALRHVVDDAIHRGLL